MSDRQKEELRFLHRLSPHSLPCHLYPASYLPTVTLFQEKTLNTSKSLYGNSTPKQTWLSRVGRPASSEWNCSQATEVEGDLSPLLS